jgi:hypothetical protein
MAKPQALEVLVKQLDNPDPRKAAEAGVVLSERLEEDAFTADELVLATDAIFAAFQQRWKVVFAQQQSDGNAWLWDEDYAMLRYEVEMLLDLIGHLPTSNAEAALRAVFTLRDPLLKFWAVLGLLRQGKDVEQPVLDELAARAVTRNKLYHLLHEAEMDDRFPKPCATQAAFAGSDMVDWLTYPTELAREPDEIEQVAVVTQEMAAPLGLVDYYVFRFRTLPPHWAAEQGWMGGVSGPYIRAEEPTPNAQGQTFSKFEPWEGTTPEQLVHEIQELFEGMLGEDEEA